MIPGSVVRFFLRGVARELQLCALGVRRQPARSPALRSLHGLDQEQGALLIDVAPLSAAAQAGVRPGDVLLAVDGVAVAEDGTVAFREAERIGSHGHVKQGPSSGHLGSTTSCRGAWWETASAPRRCRN